MAGGVSRRLLCTRRQVPLDRSDDYLLAWLAFRSTAATLGARAWIFRRVGHEDHFMEFLEWDALVRDPMDDVDMSAAAAQLDSFGSMLGRDEWEEAT
jgi:hypothetical protein